VLFCFLAILGAEKQSQFKAKLRALAGNPKKVGGEKLPSLSFIDNVFVTVFFIDFCQEKRIIMIGGYHLIT